MLDATSDPRPPTSAEEAVFARWAADCEVRRGPLRLVGHLGRKTAAEYTADRALILSCPPPAPCPAWCSLPANLMSHDVYEPRTDGTLISAHERGFGDLVWIVQAEERDEDGTLTVSPVRIRIDSLDGPCLDVDEAGQVAANLPRAAAMLSEIAGQSAAVTAELSA